MDRFKPNRSFDEELAKEPGTILELRRVAEVVKREAEARASRIMPRNPDAFKVEVHGKRVTLANTDYGGHLEEWGSANNPPHAPLRTGVRSAGLRLDEN